MADRVVPKVSIVLPVYNEAARVERALRGVIEQDFHDFELVVVDDGSTDGTTDILRRAARKETRIRLLEHTANAGIIKSLNDGIAASRGMFIAREDADDLSLPARIGKQVAFLEREPAYGLVATGYRKVTPTGEVIMSTHPPATHTEIRWKLLFGCPFVHSSVMLRASVVQALAPLYRNKFHAEDYDAWTRLARSTRLASLSEVLVEITMREGSVSDVHAAEQTRTVQEISHRELSMVLGRALEHEEAQSLRMASRPLRWKSPSVAVVDAMLELFASFEKLPDVTTREVRQIRVQWLRQMLLRARGIPSPARMRIVGHLAAAAPGPLMRALSMNAAARLRGRSRRGDHRSPNLEAQR